jgi:benzoate transport
MAPGIRSESSAAGADPRTILAEGVMGVRQYVAVGICLLLNALDGFDVLAITFAAPGIGRSWRIGPAEIGMVISAGLAGMVIGALLLGQLADRFGRRPAIVGSLIVMTLGMLASASAADVVQLCILRALTGLGIGAMLASINAMAAEFANARRRDFAVSMMAIGYPAGGVLGGWASAELLRSHGWESIFVLGGLATLALIPVVLLLLPESVNWLAASGRADALVRVNAVLRRLGHSEARSLGEAEGPKPGLRACLQTPLLGKTLALTAMYALHMMTYYYALGWVPSLVTSQGFDQASAAMVAVVMNLGGIAGGIVVGLLAPRLGIRRILAMGLVGSAGAVILFGAVPGSLALLRCAGIVLGFFGNGAIIGLYALVVRVYPATLRAGGTGLVIGFGRIGAALGPLIAGQALAFGANRLTTSTIMAAGSLLAVLALLALRGGAEPHQFISPATGEA